MEDFIVFSIEEMEVKTPHTALFTGPTSCGKTQKVLDLIEKEYIHHFEHIVILCPTLRWNKTYKERLWILKDPHVYLIEPGDQLFGWVEKLSTILANQETLFIVDDMIADSSMDKKRQPLLELAISGRHRGHSLWLLTQSYTAIPKNLRRQKKQLWVWYPNEKSDLKIIDEETNVIGDLESVNDRLKRSEHGCLQIRLLYPRGYSINDDSNDSNKESKKCRAREEKL